MSAAGTETLFFEDVAIGNRWITPPRKIGADDIQEFAELTGDRDPLHTDPDYAAETPYRGLIAHGLLGLSYLAGLSSNYPKMQNLAFLSIEGWQFCAPVQIGDSVHVETTITKLRRKGRRAGEVTWHRRLVNQDGRTVQEGQLVTLVACRSFAPRAKTKTIHRIDAAHQKVPAPISAPKNPTTGQLRVS